LAVGHDRFWFGVKVRYQRHTLVARPQVQWRIFLKSRRWPLALLLQLCWHLRSRLKKQTLKGELQSLTFANTPLICRRASLQLTLRISLFLFRCRL